MDAHYFGQFCDALCNVLHIEPFGDKFEEYGGGLFYYPYSS